jgi:hypothetical protein
MQLNRLTPTIPRPTLQRQGEDFSKLPIPAIWGRLTALAKEGQGSSNPTVHALLEILKNPNTPLSRTEKGVIDKQWSTIVENVMKQRAEEEKRLQATTEPVVDPLEVRTDTTVAENAMLVLRSSLPTQEEQPLTSEGFSSLLDEIKRLTQIERLENLFRSPKEKTSTDPFDFQKTS